MVHDGARWVLCKMGSVLVSKLLTHQSELQVQLIGPRSMSMCFGTTDQNNVDVARQQRGSGQGQGRQQQRQVISDEIRATLVHHVLIHGRTMREAGQLVQPNLSCYTAASIVSTFRRENRSFALLLP